MFQRTTTQKENPQDRVSQLWSNGAGTTTGSVIRMGSIAGGLGFSLSVHEKDSMVAT
jgi:hypothetical protein